MSTYHYEQRQPVPEHTHRLIEHLSSGRGWAPTVGDRTMFDGSGMITVCPHGLVLREGWPQLPEGASGMALIDFAIRWKKPVHHTSLPAHCKDCAGTTETRAA